MSYLKIKQHLVYIIIIVPLKWLQISHTMVTHLFLCYIYTHPCVWTFASKSTEYEYNTLIWFGMFVSFIHAFFCCNAYLLISLLYSILNELTVRCPLALNSQVRWHFHPNVTVLIFFQFDFHRCFLIYKQPIKYVRNMSQMQMLFFFERAKLF